MYKDLREALNHFEKIGLLKRVKATVDLNLELAEILRRVMYKKGPALLFESIKDYPNWRVVGNMFGSIEMVKIALDVDDLESIGKRFLEPLMQPLPMGIFDKLKSLPELLSFSKYLPKKVGSGPVKDLKFDGDKAVFDLLPIPKIWPKDGGKYITYPLVITRDPESGVNNMGVYRMQVLDNKRAAMHWQVHKRGALAYLKAKESGEKRINVSVVIGADPATMFSGVAPVPYPIDKLLFAGIVRGDGIEVVKSENSDIYVPARAEIVLEGYVNVDELVMEGPFGDHMGYYTPPEPYPVFHLETITMRHDPIYYVTVVGKPPLEDAWIGKAIERVFLPIIKILLPEIVDINLPEYGLFQGLGIVSIKKRYPGHARKVMMGLWGLGQFSLTKMLIIVDHDVNVHDINQVIYNLVTNVDPARDIMIINNAVTDVLDPASTVVGIGSKLGIDATRKLPEECGKSWPEPVEPDPEIVKLVNNRWHEYGI